MSLTFYLIGAGASYHSVPVIDKIPDRLLAFLKVIDDYRPEEKQVKFKGETVPLRHVLSHAAANIREMSTQALSYYSIDAYAQSLLTRGFETQYQLIKCLLAFFIIYEETVVTEDIPFAIDPRYIQFWHAEIDGNPLKLPKCKILSWNYDTQFERAYETFYQVGSLRKIQAMINVHPFHATSEPTKDYSKDFGIFKLNGSTTFNNDRNHGFNNPVDDPANKDVSIILDKLIQYYIAIANQMPDVFANLGFTWQPGSASSNVLQMAIQGLDQCRKFVVIGYSFPDSNRHIDSQILAHIHPDCKIYVQDPNAEDIIDTLKSRFPNDLSLRFDPIAKTIKASGKSPNFLVP